MKRTQRAAPCMRAVIGLLMLGAVHALAFSPGPLPSWSLAAVQLITFALLTRATLWATSPRRAFTQGWLFNFASFSQGLSWIFISLHTYGYLPAPLALASVLTLAAFLAMFPALACGLARLLAPMNGAGDPIPRPTPKHALYAALVWAATWSAFEWVRGTLGSGFPWLNIGYAHVDSPVAGWAPLLGVYGMAFIAAFSAVAVALLWSPTASPNRAGFACVGSLAIATVLVGWGLRHIEWSHPIGQLLPVRLVQGNIEQSQKFDPTLMQEGLVQHMKLAALPPLPNVPAPLLIILPETILPVYQDSLDPQIWDSWTLIAAERGATIAMGVPLHDHSNGVHRYTNSVMGFDGFTSAAQLRTGATGMRYDKQHLVPWGEYVPPGFQWLVNMLAIPLGDFDRGAAHQASFAIADQHISFNICYENLFGEELLPALLPGPNGEPGATVLANISNLGWFGRSLALGQHLQISRLRTLEMGRPMVAATNTGITATIDARGRVVATLPPHQAGALDVGVQGMTGLTPYARWGNKPALALMGLILLIAVARKYWKRNV
jgi:apolipoprotein N-acyltransferase